MPTQSWKAILVAVRDPGARKQIAIRKAARIAAASGARITLFHAFSAPFPLPDPMPSDPGAICARLPNSGATSCRNWRARCARRVSRWSAKWSGISRRHTRSYATFWRDKPDLVVAESHRHSRVARWFLANSDWELIRECPCPVWFVKQERLAKKCARAGGDRSDACAREAGRAR